MNLRSFRIPTMLCALLAPLLCAATASAQYVNVVYDGPRFRGGIDLEGGALLIPGAVSLGALGLRGETGVQINNNWGVYAEGSFDGMFGQLGGLGIGVGLLVDYTFDGLPISVGGGPELGVFAAIGDTTCPPGGGGCTSSSEVGAFYGARLHFAYYPVMVRYAGRPRRRALALGFDLRMLDGAFGASNVNQTNTTATVSVNSFALSPMLSIGYTAF